MPRARRLLSGMLLLHAAALTPAFAQTRWSEATASLPLSGACVATYDTTQNRVLVVQPTETWAIASATGVRTQLTGPTPGGGSWLDALIAYDPIRQRAVLFGGYDGIGNARGVTQQLANGVWQTTTTAAAPPARHSAGMCFDAAAGVVRLVAGDAAPFGAATQPLADVWTFDGAQWTQAAAGPGGPSGPTEMAYDARRGRCVAWAANGTFEWVGSGFVPVATTVTPPPRRAAAFVYDAFRERVVLHGGVESGATTRGDVYEYDGVDWRQRQPLGTFVRRHWHGTAFDPIAKAVRVFAGVETLVTLGGLVTTTFQQASELRYEAASPALAQHFAQGCYFNDPLTPVGLPWLGDAVTLTMPAAGPIPPLLAFGVSNEQVGGAPLPLPIAFLGFPQCELVCSADVVVPMAVSGTAASATLPVPNQPLLLGYRLYAQGFAPDLAGNGVGTNGVLVQVGGR